MDSTAHSSYVHTLFPSQGMGKDETWKYRVQNTQGSHLPQNNKCQSRHNPNKQLQHVEGSEQKQQHRRTGGGGEGATPTGNGCAIPRVCATSGSTGGLWRRKRRPDRWFRQGESHLCLQDGCGVAASKLVCPSPGRLSSWGDACGGDDGGRRQTLTWGGCSRPCTRPSARLLFSSPRKYRRPPGL